MSETEETADRPSGRMIYPGMRPRPTLREMAQYTSKMADGAQIRKVKAAVGESVTLLDDTWWQSVMDFVRYELSALADKYEPEAKPEDQPSR